jgi:acetyl-CoA decarbonylase/synthase complex subunit gamma
MKEPERPVIQNPSNNHLVLISERQENVRPGENQPFICGVVKTAAGAVPRVSSDLTGKDRWGAIKARLSAFRMDYRIDPGLYALGEPDQQSFVFVSANYKMSFDVLRKSLAGRSAWILVLDTKGINVWCAAGKGTFGTEELIRTIELSGLKKVVSHRTLILPQLGAPGVAAHRVKKISGFQVLFGPVRAQDLPAYLDGGCRATTPMRTITFPLPDRVVLIPIELRGAMKYFFMLSALLLLISGFGGPQGIWDNIADIGLFAVLALLCAVTGGAVLVPLLLPYLPGRPFSVKGFSLGMIIAFILVIFRDINLTQWTGCMEALAWFFMIPSVTAYLAMNFTGCSTYTSLSGVKREMRRALPLQAAGGLIGMALWIGAVVMS